MIDTLNSYLVQHRSLSIPGVGTIHIERFPAISTADSKQLLPPAFVYRYDKFHDTPVKEFFLFVAEQKKIPEYEAIKLYNEFAAEFRSDIKLKEEAVWNNVGVFKKDDSGEILFEQIHKQFVLFAPIDAEEMAVQVSSIPVISSGEKVPDDIPAYCESHHATDNRNMKKWWVYALALFVVTAVILWVHFYNKGLIWQAFFNQQPAY